MRQTIVPEGAVDETDASRTPPEEVVLLFIIVDILSIIFGAESMIRSQIWVWLSSETTRTPWEPTTRKAIGVIDTPPPLPPPKGSETVALC